jgi:hypothetical protein
MASRTHGIVERLVASHEPSVRYKALVKILGDDPDSQKLRKLRSKIRSSQRVKQLLSERRSDGRIPYHPYGKWYGSHWVLTDLADLYYPEEDRTLIPLREQEHEWLFSETHLKTAPYSRSRGGDDFSEARPRIHASMEGNAVFSILRLGLHDEKTDELVDRLLRTQWPDGGWNCDRRPAPANPVISSFHETLVPLRALSLHGQVRNSQRSRLAARKAARIFLKRRMFRKQRDGRIINDSFVKLHYPPYWHYDVLFGLKVMAEAGLVKDTRCKDALDLLESKQLPDGGFPAEARYYHLQKHPRSAMSLVNWGGVSSARMNEFVTVDALHVLKAAGRI